MKPIDADALKERLKYLPGTEIMKNEIDDMGEIDPVHAAGGVYCRECDHAHPNENGNYMCALFDSLIASDDFCNFGKKREDLIANDE